MPRLSTTSTRAVFGLSGAIFGVAIAAAGGPLAWLTGAVLLAVTVRALMLDIKFDDGEVVIRNLLSTIRIPRSQVASFGTRWSAVHGGSVLYVEQTDGTCTNVTAYPITRIPAVARRRRAAVADLNEWLHRWS